MKTPWVLCLLAGIWLLVGILISMASYSSGKCAGINWALKEYHIAGECK